MRKAAIEIAKTWNKNLTAGDTLEGYYIKHETFKGQYGESDKYVILDKSNEKWAVFGSASISRQFENIPEGSYIWITYKGEEQTKSGRPVKVYQIDYDDAIQPYNDEFQG